MRAALSTMRSIAAAFLLAAPALRAQPAEARVIVNAANPVASLTRDEATKLFLGRTKKWPQGGAPVQPVDQPDRAAVRRAFSKGVLGRDVEAISAYWAQQIFTGEGVAPPTRPDDAGVIAFVAAAPGAVGYVSAAATLPPTVKAVPVTTK